MLNEPSNKQQMKLRIPSAMPVMTIILLVILVSLFVARLGVDATNDTLLWWGGNHTGFIFERQELHRLITALFLVDAPYAPQPVVSVLLGIISVYTLYIIGNSTEKLWGNLRFFLVYLFGGVAGSLVMLFLSLAGLVPQDVYFAGAPNAIMALMGAELVYLYKHRKLFGKRGILRRNFMVSLMLINLLAGTLAPRVSIYGMLGGMLGGAILAAYISPFLIVRAHPEEPGALLGEDVNPLRRRILPIALYISALIGALLVGVLVMT